MNIIYVFLLMLWTTFPLIASSWNSLLEQHKALMSSQTYEILMAQLHAYQTNCSPKIADPIIKEIPIIESHEALADCSQAAHPRIHMLPAPPKPFASPDCNSGFPCASRVRKEVFNRLVITIEYLDKLAPHFGYQPGQIHLMVFEGLRDFDTQKMLFENKLKEIRQNFPQLSEEQAFAETSKWVSPVRNNIPVHATGGAIDIRAWDAHANTFLDVGPFGVIWGPNANAPTFSENVTDAQKVNRLYVLIATQQAGLINYAYEHWHFSCGDRYATFWLNPQKESRHADYGLVDNNLLAR